MKKSNTFKGLCMVFAFVFAFVFTMPANTVSAADSSMSLDEQRTQLEKNLAEVNAKLDELGTESKETEEYIDALDQKIQYLNQQYQLAKQEADAIEEKVENLEKTISNNEDEIKNIKLEITDLEKQTTELNNEFEDTYELFAQRMRAMYVSGYQVSTLTFLLESDGMAQLYTRYEMIKAVSRQDGILLANVKVQTDEIVKTVHKLGDKRTELEDSRITLAQDKESLKTEKIDLLEKQEDMQSQRSVIEQQQLEANALLKQLHDKTKKYGEYRDITQEELDEIDAAIEEADKKYTTTTTTTPTTTTTTTTHRADNSQHEPGTTKPTTTTTTKKPQSNYISLTYPCPAYTTITCGFGAYAGHTGCDFSTRGNVNQKIVAAESGTVIISADLTNSDGSYRSYGRYIVIRHDKTTSSGKTVYTLYAHNNRRVVSEGEHVSKGQLIAYSGSTGNSTGPHCHFEVRVGGPSQSYAVNPANYLP